MFRAKWLLNSVAEGVEKCRGDARVYGIITYQILGFSTS
jgi:hypothetical protein